MFASPRNSPGHTQRLIVTICWATALLIGIHGCSGSSQRNATIGDLVQHFKKSGLQGEYYPKFAGLIGAKEGGSYSGDGFEVEIYIFEDVTMAESLEKSRSCYRNGRFILSVYEGEAKVLPLFNRF